MSDQNRTAAVSDAMREAVLALLHVKLSARITGPAWEQVRIEWLGFGEVADAICAPAGPIASEIARLTGENADLREQAGRTVSIRQMQEVVERLRAAEAETAVLTAECKVYRGLAEKYAAAAEAAEAETARLRAERDGLQAKFDRLASGCPWDGPPSETAKYLPADPCPVCGDTGEINNDRPIRCTAYAGGRKNLAAALSSQEKTDA
jgi:hypothetical protein